MPGQRAAGQQQKTHCPLVYTQPHPLPRPGPGPFLLSTRPPPLPLSSPFLPLLKQIAHLHLKWKKSAGEKAPVLHSSWWIYWVNDGKLGANLQALCSFTP